MGSADTVDEGMLIPFWKACLLIICPRMRQRFIREASVWSTLDDPNVLPFLGIAEPPGIGVCLVSPWMENGNSYEYLDKRRDISPFRIVSPDHTS